MPRDEQARIDRDDAMETDVRAPWRRHIANFKRDLYPVFEAEGFTLPEAMLVYNARHLFVAMTRTDDFT